MPEFEAALGNDRLPVEEFANRMSGFFVDQWNKSMQGVPGDMIFFVGGYDHGDTYGKVFEMHVPNQPTPKEWHPGNRFGVVWGGQKEYVERLIIGFDPKLPGFLQQEFELDDATRDQITAKLKSKLIARVPFQFLPLQDCIDLTIFLIRTTVQIQTWLIGVRGVGGFIDVATITRTEGFKPVQQKAISGERGV